MMNAYSNEENRARILRASAVILAIIFLASAAFFFLSLWERKHESFKDSGTVALKEVLQYNGKEYVLKENIETYLFLGLDKFNGESADSYNNEKQADFLMLLVADNKNSSYTALHINRDTIAEIDMLGVAGDKIGTEKSQIALAHTYGNGKEVSCRNTAKAVSKLLLGAEIDHYVSATMDAVAVYNDYIGGIEVTVLDDFTGIDDTLVKGETVTLRGEHSLNYVRTRYGLDDSTNNNRMARQQQYLKALYSKTQQELENNDSFIEQQFLKLNNYIVTDCSANKLQAFMNKLSGYEFTGILDIDGETVKGKKFMEFYPDEESVKEVAIKLFYKPQD